MITITIPRDPVVLRAFARTLDSIADGLTVPVVDYSNNAEKLGLRKSAGPVQEAPFVPPDAFAALGSTPAVPETPANTMAQAAPNPNPGNRVLPPLQTAPAVPTPLPAVVALDPTGQPWDVRIHVSTKTRLKGSDTWKLKPKVDKNLVLQVRAEHTAERQRNLHVDTPKPQIDATLPDVSFRRIMQVIGPRVSDETYGTVYAEKINETMLAHGVTTNTLHDHPHLIPTINAELEKIWLTMQG